MFQPTYLYIKQHSITGKLYFGKTIRDPEKYIGSGSHWVNHIKKHGKEYVNTIWYCMFYDEKEIKNFALLCSSLWKIVESDCWLNMMPENGLDNCTLKGIPKSDEHKRKIKESNINTRKRNPIKYKTRTNTKTYECKTHYKIWYLGEHSPIIVKNLSNFCKEKGIIYYRARTNNVENIQIIPI